MAPLDADFRRAQGTKSPTSSGWKTTASSKGRIVCNSFSPLPNLDVVAVPGSDETGSKEVSFAICQ